MSNFEQFFEDVAEETKGRRPMNLQFFAGEGAGDEGDGGGTGDEGDGSGAGSDEGNQEPTFDDVLTNREHQAEFDRRVQQAIKTALTNEREKMEMLADEKISEAEKLAKMNKEEKAEYLRTKKEKELAAKERDLNTRELKAEAMTTLADKGLPIGLAECLDYTDADSCSKSIEAVQKAFEESVKKAVEEKLKGKAPMGQAPGEDLPEKEQLLKIINDPKTAMVDRIAAKNKLYTLKED